MKSPKRISILFLLTILTSTSSCASTTKDVRAAAAAILDCTKVDAGQLAAAVLQLAAAAVMELATGAEIDWAALATTAEASGKAIGTCAYTELASSTAGAPKPSAKASVGPLDWGEAYTQVERLRAWAGVTTIRTPSGDL